MTAAGKQPLPPPSGDGRVKMGRRTGFIFLGNGGWWCRIEKPGSFMERGPYPFRWMARMAYPINRWIW